MKRSCVWGGLLLALTETISGGGCRTTRQEVPPPPSFARDGRKLGGNPVGFGSAPRASYMTDAANQIAPGIAAPGGDRTSMAGTDALRDSPPATTTGPATQPQKGTIGRMFDGLGSASASVLPKRDDAVGKAGYGLPTPASAPLDPPVSLPPPPLIPPPPASAETSPPPAKSSGEKSPQPLPGESALPPLVPEPVP